MFFFYFRTLQSAKNIIWTIFKPCKNVNFVYFLAFLISKPTLTSIFVIWINKQYSLNPLLLSENVLIGHMIRLCFHWHFLINNGKLRFQIWHLLPGRAWLSSKTNDKSWAIMAESPRCVTSYQYILLKIVPTNQIYISYVPTFASRHFINFHPQISAKHNCRKHFVTISYTYSLWAKLHKNLPKNHNL